ncbi:DUF4214 domain-containing protein [Paraclostridium bifermentans]|uniref:DUF4214 domain-containing protein n=1 Tax=Paraclostridium bifermentans TaxID=1490 RepID=A0ABY8R5K7_PARBF|nr:DUF4214 domain-containing protein [Paraclostridium bifermentans]
MKKITISLMIALNLCSMNFIDINAETKDMKNVKKYEQDQTQEQNYIRSEASTDIKENCKIIIRQIYKGFYGREVDNDGLEYWANEIASGKRSVADILEQFINGDEFKNKNYNNQEYVKSLYIGLQGREPDKSGLDYWTDLLNLGQSRKFVLYSVFNSDEFQNKLNLMEIKNKGQINIDLNDKKGSVKDLVNQFYKGLYGREGDNEGLEYWANQILDGKKSIAEILLTFTNSDEFKSKNYNNEEYIKSLYNALFKRNPDSDGLNYWSNMLNDGNSRKFVLAENMNSGEFQETLNNIGIKNKGTIEIDLNDKKREVKGLINQFYKGFYGREGDNEGLEYWANQILDGKKSVAEILLTFINSDEFKGKNYNNEEYVKSLYNALFKRNPDSNGLNYWTSRLNDGNSRKFVLAENMNSGEFQETLNNIGIKNKGTIEINSAEPIISFAKQQLGKPYVWDTAGPNSFDCSGFIYYVFSHNGYNISRTSVAGYWGNSNIQKISIPKPGDLIFFKGTYGGANHPSHIGIVINNHQFIQASSTKGVCITDINNSYWKQHFLGYGKIIQD